MEEKYGLEVVTPEKDDRDCIHEIIYNELCMGKIKPSSQKEYHRITQTLTHQGCEGVILGCTEIGMLLKQKDTEIPLFDTTKIHAAKAVERALST